MDFQTVKKKIFKELNLSEDPFSKSDSWELIEKYLPQKLWPLLYQRSGAADLSKALPQVFTPKKLASNIEIKTSWERIGNFYRNRDRFYQALSIYFPLYYQLFAAQNIDKKHIHKGEPLVWISECYYLMGFPLHAKRYLMLTLCEDAIRMKGTIPPDSTGVYWRLVFRHGLSDQELKRYGKEAYKIWSTNQEKALFPEWIVQKFDKDWLIEFPSPNETGIYMANPIFIENAISQLGDKTGKTLEILAEYILSCMPGCITARRKKTQSSELDIVCSMSGFEVDFRSEFGRYFVCECKDWKKPADFSTIAKFCRTLDSIKSKFGILFSTYGISGKGRNKDAELERLKIFQDRGIVIVVIDRNDLMSIVKGENFISLLKKKYEKVRLDLSKKI